MSPKNTNTNKGNDDFDDIVDELYELSLLDEDFQQQKLSDLQHIPEEGKSLLNKKTQSFIQDQEPPAELMQTIFAEINKQHKEGSTSPSSEKKASFITKLFSWNNFSFSFLSLGFAVPASLALGLVSGLYLAPAIIQSQHPDTAIVVTDSGWRGSGNGLPPNPPNVWLEQINTLIKNGEIQEAITQLELFHKRYPDYKPDSTPD